MAAFAFFVEIHNTVLIQFSECHLTMPTAPSTIIVLASTTALASLSLKHDSRDLPRKQDR